MVRLEQHEQGPRFYLWGWRVHHAHLGFALIAAGVRLIWNDRRDAPWR